MLELIPLCSLDLELEPPIAEFDGPLGHRVVVQVRDVKITGERLSGQLKRYWTDSATVSGGVITLSVRGVIGTHDGATVFLTYTGRGDLSKDETAFYCAPQFETGDSRYTWLNTIQAVGKGSMSEKSMHYDWYEVR